MLQTQLCCCQIGRPSQTQGQGTALCHQCTSMTNSTRMTMILILKGFEKAMTMKISLTDLVNPQSKAVQYEWAVSMSGSKLP